MSWQIVEQEKSVGKGEVELVRCKILEFFPKKSKIDDEVRFGEFNFTLLRVLIKNEHGTQHSITYSDKSGRGKYIYHWPEKLILPKYKAANGKYYEDKFATPVKRPGEKQEFYNDSSFYDWLKGRVGDLATEIMEEFRDKRDLAELQRQERQEKRLKRQEKQQLKLQKA